MRVRLSSARECGSAGVWECGSVGVGKWGSAGVLEWGSAGVRELPCGLCLLILIPVFGLEFVQVFCRQVLDLGQ